MTGEIKTPPEYFTLGKSFYVAFDEQHTLADILRYAVQQAGGSCDEVRLILNAIEKEPSP